MPLVKDAPFVKDLTLNAAGRYSDFSNFGGAKTYKVGVNYTPFDGLRFRGAYGTSFRAGRAGTVRGRRQRQRPYRTIPATRARARSVRPTPRSPPTAPWACRQLLPDRQHPPADPFGRQPGAGAERGRTFTIGAIIQPAFWPEFTATLDYYDIRIKNAIGTGNQQINLNNCYADRT